MWRKLINVKNLGAENMGAHYIILSVLYMFKSSLNKKFNGWLGSVKFLKN